LAQAIGSRRPSSLTATTAGQRCGQGTEASALSRASGSMKRRSGWDREEESKKCPSGPVGGAGFSSGTDRMTMKFLVPANEASCILGKGGSTVRELGMASGTKISLSARNEYYPGTDLQQLRIHGASAEAVMISILMVFAKIAEVTGTVSGGEYGVEPGGARVKVVVPCRVSEELLGNGGSTMKQIRQESDMHAQVEEAVIPPGSTSESSEQVVVLVGPLTGVQAAITSIMNVMMRFTTEPWYRAWSENSQCGSIIPGFTLFPSTGKGKGKNVQFKENAATASVLHAMPPSLKQRAFTEQQPSLPPQQTNFGDALQAAAAASSMRPQIGAGAGASGGGADPAGDTNLAGSLGVMSEQATEEIQALAMAMGIELAGMSSSGTTMGTAPGTLAMATGGLTADDLSATLSAALSSAVFSGSVGGSGAQSEREAGGFPGSIPPPAASPPPVASMGNAGAGFMAAKLLLSSEEVAILGQDGGACLLETQQLTGTVSQVSESLYPGCHLHELNLQGNSGDLVLSATMAILQTILEARGVVSAGEPNLEPGGARVKVVVPAKAAAGVIGAGGANITAIQQQTGCRINIDMNFVPCGETGKEQAILLSGQLKAVCLGLSSVFAEVAKLNSERWFRRWASHSNAGTTVPGITLFDGKGRKGKGMSALGLAM